MKTVKIRNLKVGDGIPKICVPIVGRTKDEIEDSICQILEYGTLPDMVEFRADWFENVLDEKQTCAILCMIREKLNEIPVLFTVRTAEEGGERAFDFGEYKQVLCNAAKSGYIDAVDVEAFSYTGMEGVTAAVEQLVESLKNYKCVVVGSNHDFDATPSVLEMTKRLRRMCVMGMDIAKIAVMPHDAHDVVKLLAATAEVSCEQEMCPVITMSMSGLGVISRLSGEVFGSAVTFASVGRASAPGQVPLEQIKETLQLVHAGR